MSCTKCRTFDTGIQDFTLTLGNKKTVEYTVKEVNMCLPMYNPRPSVLLLLTKCLNITIKTMIHGLVVIG